MIRDYDEDYDPVHAELLDMKPEKVCRVAIEDGEAVLGHPRRLPRRTARGTGGAGMTVYVDDMQAPFGRMKMCHMIADSTDELLAMADKIGVARKWIQKPGTHLEHFDIAMSKRALAVRFGAVEVTRRELGGITLKRRESAQEQNRPRT